ncbi:restriction endonuclease subunit S [Nostoc sp. UHCC 0926]|uniref:restriction endonuclease subunit S n=1 Tax=unclassified Nostoc TaxID=2593658 RepID=UPI00235E3435|nr:restriction endonuclease subunit S [Nostoc sp. UHCC 0926]WDD33308.1 restriction endonuclease subunit S [Nostoc sp. UHCC 0926]
MFNHPVPTGWVDCFLKDAIARVVGGGTPSRTVPAYWNGDISWASVKDFKDETQYLHNTEEYISSLGLLNSAANLIEAGVPLICTRMAVGRAAIPTKPVAINQDLKAVYTYNQLSNRYLLLLLNFIRPSLESLSIGSTVKGITISQLLTIPVILPPLLEQQKIAEIFDAIDKAIALTDTHITKLKKAKAGLLHDLLTRGIDEHGELRDYTRNPELFKRSALGIIPKDWDIELLNAILSSIDAGKSPSCPDRPAMSGEWGVLKISAVHPNGFKPEENKAIINSAYIKTEYQVNDGDLLITRANTYELVGLVCLVENPPPNLLLCDKTLRLKVINQRVSKAFLYYILQMPYLRLQIQNNAVGSSAGMKNITQEIIKNFIVSIPKNLSEQELIVTTLEKKKSQILEKVKLREKLKLLKKGLMSDLLTGRVRVKI